MKEIYPFLNTVTIYNGQNIAPYGANYTAIFVDAVNAFLFQYSGTCKMCAWAFVAGVPTPADEKQEKEVNMNSVCVFVNSEVPFPS